MEDSAAVTDLPVASGDGAGAAYGPFAYLNAPNAPIYRRVMRALMAEKERFTVHVRPEQVSEALRVDGGREHRRHVGVHDLLVVPREAGEGTAARIGDI